MKIKTSIQVFVETKDRLVKEGKKGETYDDIIRRLLTHWGMRHIKRGK